MVWLGRVYLGAAGQSGTGFNRRPLPDRYPGWIGDWRSRGVWHAGVGTGAGEMVSVSILGWISHGTCSKKK